MPAVSQVAISGFSSGNGSLSVGAVSGVQAGDFIILFVESANQAVTTPSGFTEFSVSPQGTGTAAAAGGVRLTAYYQWATGPDSTTSIADSGDHTTAIKIAYREVDPDTPIDAIVGSVQSSASASWSLPGVTTVTDGAYVVHGIANDRDSNANGSNLSGWSNGSLTNLTKDFDRTVNTGAGGGLGVISGTMDVAGATGNTSVTNAASTTAAFITIALRPIVYATIIGTGAIADSPDSSAASGAIRVAGTSAAVDSADKTSAVGRVQPVSRGVAVAADNRDVASAAGAVTGIDPGNLPAPVDGQPELARSEYAAELFAWDDAPPSVEADAEMTASATLAGAGAHVVSASASMSVSASMAGAGGIKTSSVIAPTVKATADFSGHQVAVGVSGMPVTVTGQFVTGIVSNAESSMTARVTADFQSVESIAGEAEAAMRVGVDLEPDSAAIQQAAGSAAAAVGALFVGQSVTSSAAAGDVSASFAAFGGSWSVASTDLSAVAKANFRGQAIVVRQVSMSGVVAFLAAGQAVAQARATATATCTASFVGDYKQSSNTSSAMSAGVTATFHSGAVQSGAASASVRAAMEADSSLVSQVAAHAAVGVRFVPTAGQSYLTNLVAADEGVVVPHERRGAVVVFEDRVAEEGAA